jgi:hypothetical protein
LLGGDPSAAPAADPAKAAADPAKPADPAAKPTVDPAKPVVTGAPEKYEFKFAPDVVVDTAALEAFTPVLKGLNLTQDQAQQLVDIYAAQTQAQSTAFGAKLQDPAFAVEQAGLMLANHRDTWASAIKADKDIGGANFDANVQTAQRALARFGSPELKGLLETTGLGNHPALVRAFVQIGKQIREDTPDYGSLNGGARKSNAEVFYGGNPATAGA